MVSLLSNQQNTAVHDHDDAVGQAGYKEKHQQDGRSIKSITAIRMQALRNFMNQQHL